MDGCWEFITCSCGTAKTFRNKLADARDQSFHFEQVWHRSVQRWQSYQPDQFFSFIYYNYSRYIFINGSDHEVVACYLELYEEDEVEHISMVFSQFSILNA